VQGVYGDNAGRPEFHADYKYLTSRIDKKNVKPAWTIEFELAYRVLPDTA
jgi:hypothetical protein